MQSDGPRFLSLCDRVVLVEWSLPGDVDGSCTLDGTFGQPVIPISVLRLARSGGGTRVIWALRKPEEDGAIYLAAAGGEGSTSIQYEAGHVQPVDITIFDDLTPAARLSLTSALLDLWSSLFKVKNNRSYARTLRTLLKEPEQVRDGIQVMFAAGGGTFIEVAVDRRMGPLKHAHMIRDGRVCRIELEPMVVRTADRARGIRRFFCRSPRGEPPALVAMRFQYGVVVREWPKAAKVPAMEVWWGQANRDVGLREECLGLLNASGELGLAASTEFQLRCPLKQSAVMGSEDLPSAHIELALAGPKGLLVGGWYRDASNFVSGFDLLDHEDVGHSFDDRRVDFPGLIPGPDNTHLDATGFVSFIPAIAGPWHQPRFLLRMRSGARHLLVPPIQPIDWPAARAAALRAVPPQHLTDSVIENCLAPILSEYQAAAQQSIGKPTVIHIGTPLDNPAVSLVIPLYRVLDFLPFQIAAFASDPQILFRCELIYVLDSPEQATLVEHMLTGLHMVYGIPITLLVMARNGGYSFANNRALDSVRSPNIALVNSDVIPLKDGWVGVLEQRLSSGIVGAVGPKLLFEDDSIQHAGLFFSRDHRDRWLNHHYFKGMPRHYLPATTERSVPGITGACMMLRRDLFEAVGGFTEDYVIGDYEDSDLCLKIRQRGLDIVYVPEAELYHLERRSMNQNADYTRGVASQYNSWLHHQRWDSTMTELMAEFTTISAPSSSALRKVA